MKTPELSLHVHVGKKKNNNIQPKYLINLGVFWVCLFFFFFLRNGYTRPFYL